MLNHKDTGIVTPIILAMKNEIRAARKDLSGV